MRVVSPCPYSLGLLSLLLLRVPILKLPRLALAVLGKGLDDRYSPYRQSPSIPTNPVANALGVMYSADDSVLTGIAV